MLLVQPRNGSPPVFLSDTSRSLRPRDLIAHTATADGSVRSDGDGAQLCGRPHHLAHRAGDRTGLLRLTEQCLLR